MGKAAFLVVLLYLAMFVTLTVPMLLVCFPGEVSVSDAIQAFQTWQYWLYVGLMLLGEFALLTIPLKRARARPISRRSIWFPVAAAGFLLACLCLGTVTSIAEFVQKDKFLDNAWVGWSAIAASLGLWIIWAILFYRYARNCTPEQIVRLHSRWLFRGSLLGLLVAVPTHVVARQRDYCCAGWGTFLGIAFGLPIMLLAFGPGIFCLYVSRWKRLHPGNAKSEGQAAPTRLREVSTGVASRAEPISQEEEREDQPSDGKQAGMSTASHGDEAASPGAQVGPYKLLRILGEGGFGLVYLAEQQEPVRRQVAFKIIKPGMDSKQVIARFEAERQALALLDHPNIAHVFDAGTTEGGRPYFVMEHVKGVPITEYCDREKLPIEGRLRLFIDVCEAIQHAHQKGIIHRDIKPSNILVTMHQDKALPVVIDFGVAKALSQPLTERTLFTEQGQLIGTPEYMSPEQAEMTNQDIDTRSDVYSLGVLLYELLTGVLPFEPTTLRAAAIAEIQRIIREENPPRPSTRLSSLGEEATEVAKRRRTEAGALTRRLHRELEWIPLKAMRKERDRRYESPRELARDIQNYLEGHPLFAGPESVQYRLRKFVRRNRALVAGAAIVLFVLTAGIVVSTVFAIGQTRARKEAERQANIARIAAEEAQRQADVARSVTRFVSDDLLGSIDEVGDEEPTVLSILERASGRLGSQFQREPEIEAEIHDTLGQAYYDLDRYSRAQPHLERALALREAVLTLENRETLGTARSLAWVHFARHEYDKAESVYARAVPVAREVFGPEHALTRSLVWGLALVRRNQGHPQEAAGLLADLLEIEKPLLGERHRSTLLTMNALADAYRRSGEPGKAERLYRETLEIGREALDPNDSVLRDLLRGLARAYTDQGRFGEAEDLLVNALDTQKVELGAEDKGTVATMKALAGLYYTQGRHGEAEAYYTETLKLQERLFGEESRSAVVTMGKLVAIYRQNGREKEAEELYRKKRDIEKKACDRCHEEIPGS